MFRFLSPTWHELQKLKKSDFSAPYVEDSPEGYRIKIIGRGELLFYQQEQKALFVEIGFDKGTASVYVDSITKWDTGKKVTEEEKALILKRAHNYFMNFQKKKAVFVDARGMELPVE